MARVLVVTNPFGDLALGDRISNPDEIEAVLAGDHRQNVIVSDHADLDPAPIADAPTDSAESAA